MNSFKIIPNTNNRYMINKEGVVFNSDTKKIISSFTIRTTVSYKLKINNSYKSYRVALLLLTTFKGDEKNSEDLVPGFKNGDVSDTRLDNLEWVSKYGHSKRRNKIARKNGIKIYPLSKIDQYSLDGKFIRTWDSVYDIERELNISPSYVYRCYSEKSRISAGGYKWRKFENKCISKKVILPELPDGVSMKDIEGFKFYSVTSNGFIYSHKSEKFLINRKNVGGYMTVALRKNQKTFPFLTHRLVAKAFIENNNSSRKEVNHKDGNIENNNVDNLEWVTTQENLWHSRNILCFPDKVKNYRGIEFEDTSKNIRRKLC